MVIEVPFTRRKFMHSVGLLGAGGLLAAYGSRTALAAAGDNIDLDFVVWTYSVDDVNSNIKAWEASNPGTTVKLQDSPWDTFHDTMV